MSMKPFKLPDDPITLEDVLKIDINFFGIKDDEFWCAIWIRGRTRLIMTYVIITGKLTGPLYHYVTGFTFTCDNPSHRLDFQILIRQPTYTKMSYIDFKNHHPELTEKIKTIVTMSRLSI